jgi:perosamine synthetase
MTATDRIPLSRPSITEKELALVTEAAGSGWGAHCYDFIHRFEREFAAHIGVQFAIATSSCTGALHMGLAALGIGPGDEVILADTGWVASMAPIQYLGAQAVLVDIDADSWCIDPVAVRAAISPRTKAIMAVHLYGNLCAMDALHELGQEFGIPVIEDAAEAMGAFFGGKRAGAMGRFGVFSFHGSKTMTTGEGGMWVSDDAALYERVLSLSNHGRVRGQARQFWPEMRGFKYKMSNLQAALGCAQLERIESLVARKQEILAYYRTALATEPVLAMNREAPATVLGAWMPTVEWPEEFPLAAQDLLSQFDKANIDARPVFAPLSTLPWMPKTAPGPKAQSFYGRAVNLPSFHDMTPSQMDRVADVVLEAVRGAS